MHERKKRDRNERGVYRQVFERLEFENVIAQFALLSRGCQLSHRCGLTDEVFAGVSESAAKTITLQIFDPSSSCHPLEFYVRKLSDVPESPQDPVPR